MSATEGERYALAARVSGGVAEEINHQLKERAAKVRAEVPTWTDLDERLRVTGIAQGLELAAEMVLEMVGDGRLLKVAQDVARLRTESP